MLGQWLAPAGLDEFRRGHFGKVPFAAAGTARATTPLFDWAAAGRVLARAPAEDVLVVVRGRSLDLPPPRDLEALRELMARGIGVVIRRGERHDPALGHFAADFARDLPGEVHLQLFVTAADTHGFGWHYDFEHVFIVQTAGVKDYYFRANTVDLDTPRGTQPRFERVREETSPLATSRLEPGDFLYVPARWWHVALCRQSSLSISVGLFEHTAAD